jgi:hypothetical protein
VTAHDTRFCVTKGCQQAPVSRGRCNRHYQAWYRENRADQKRDSDRRWRVRVDYKARLRKPKEPRTCAARTVTRRSRRRTTSGSMRPPTTAI